MSERFFYILDPTSSREIEREEQPLTIVTQSRPVKTEEKVDKVPMKRQRRQKTTSESITKEEEKKVGGENYIFACIHNVMTTTCTKSVHPVLCVTKFAKIIKTFFYLCQSYTVFFDIKYYL